MGLEAFERALALLYTDDAARERFFADPNGEGATLGLTAGDVLRITSMDRERIELFAESLRTKRFGEVRGLLPHAAGALGEEALRERFIEFARGGVPEGVNKHHADAMAFAAWLERGLDGEARDAVRFDGAVLGLFFRLDGRAAVRRAGPAIAVVRHAGRRRLLLRARNAGRYRSFPLPG